MASFDFHFRAFSKSFKTHLPEEDVASLSFSFRASPKSFKTRLLGKVWLADIVSWAFPEDFKTCLAGRFLH